MDDIGYRAATVQDWPAIATHFYQLWLDNGLKPNDIRPDWQAHTLAFIQTAAEQLDYAAFIAETSDGTLIGSVGCQRFEGLYPIIFMPHYRRDGYIWNVYVEAAYRRRGVGQQLTQLAIDHLATLGCTRVVLHASPFGRPVYTRLGFESSTEMRRSLPSP